MSQPHQHIDYAPAGWADEAPAPVAVGDQIGLTLTNCEEWRRQMLTWVAKGLAAADTYDRKARVTRTCQACWDGAVVDVARRAVEMAGAVLTIAGGYAQNFGASLGEADRESHDLPSESMRRVLALVCPHGACEEASANSMTMEAEWPTMNAAMESLSPDIGYVTPGMAVTREVDRCGGDSLPLGNEPAAYLQKAASIRLGILTKADLRLPINTRHMAYDTEGSLLAVRPRRLIECAEPDHDTLVTFFSEHPTGVSISDVAKRFGVSNDEAKRSIDALSPEFIVRGQDERCICSTGSRTAWFITSDRAKINAYIEKSGTLGRELGVVAGGKISAPFGLLESHSLSTVVRW